MFGVKLLVFVIIVLRRGMHAKISIGIIAFVVAGLAMWWVFSSGLLARTTRDGLDTQTTPTLERTVSYTCADDKTITAGYGDRLVTLTLGDGRSFTLEQTVSASGARYANNGDQIVFWNKGTTAFMEEDGEMSYTECVEEGSDAPIEID